MQGEEIRKHTTEPEAALTVISYHNKTVHMETLIEKTNDVDN